MKKSITLLIFFAMGNLSAQRELQIAGIIKSTHRHPSRIRIMQGRIIPVSHLKTGNSFTPPNLLWYKDADEDGYGDPETPSSTYQEGYVQNNEDCDDTDARINPNTVWAIDRDGDGYGDPKEQKVQCEHPQGYVKYKAGRGIRSIEEIVEVGQKPKEFCRYVEDPRFDEDERRERRYIKICHSIPRKYSLDKVMALTDCNDQDASLNPDTYWYQDADGDGLGDPKEKKQQCEVPKGYVRNKDDCDDGDAKIAASRWWYRDADEDGFGDSTLSIKRCTAPEGYVDNDQDCNDADVRMNPYTLWYRDADGDGYGIDSDTKTQCTKPPGYARHGIDPEFLQKEVLLQTSKDRKEPITYCEYGPDTREVSPSSETPYKYTCYSTYSPSPEKKEKELPSEFYEPLKPADCDDRDASLNPSTSWYKDADGDGLGDLKEKKQQCEAPKGYVKEEASDQCPAVQGEAIYNGCLDPKITPCSSCSDLSFTTRLSSNQNYIYSAEPIDGVINMTESTPKIQQITYYDGLGRPMEQIAVGANPQGKDIVTPVVYDEFGRQTKEYLPYPTEQSNGHFIEVPSAQRGVSEYYRRNYKETKGYSEKELEASPLNRVLKQAAPGEAWKLGSGHEVQFDYAVNAAGEVKRFDVVLDASYVPQLQPNGDYPAGQLYKTITKDENYTGSGPLHTTEEFKDKEGQLVLKRTYVTQQGAVQKLDTYSVYDDYGNLTYVLPPKLLKAGNYDASHLAALAYQYQYDDRNRLVEKQLPGKEREYLVYDKQDRLAATQDGVQRSTRRWLFTKYDRLGRVLYTGMTTAGDRKAVQAAVDAKGNNNEEKTDTPSSIEGIALPYTTTRALPSTIDKLLTVNEYDRYPAEAPPAPKTILGQPILTASTDISTQGLATAVYTRVLSSSRTQDWEKTYTYYDQKGRVVRIETQNHLGGYTRVDSELDFRGKPLKTETRHKRAAGDAERLTTDYFSYDHAERLVKHTQQTEGIEAVQRIAENEYDRLGRLQQKKVGGAEDGDALQNLRYTYNIRGWLTGINSPSEGGTAGTAPLFGMQLHYNHPLQKGTPALYNGNISEIGWQTATDHTERGYSYRYDALDRLNEAYFIQDGQAAEYYNVTGITYDENGNIETLQRKGSSAVSTVLIDDLHYTYDKGNRLQKAADASKNPEGFKNSPLEGGVAYTYDANGSLTADKNKGITQITYNFLHLPQEITFASGDKIEYTYNAAGVKLSKKVTINGKTTVTDYLSGYIYKDGQFKQFATAEGHIEERDGKPLYVYYYKDQTNNIRLMYADVNKTGTPMVLQERNYYPFGLEHKGYNETVAGTLNHYKNYQGQELNTELGLNWLSFKYRNYDPALGRFMSIDPLAEKYVDWAPYVFSGNRVIDALELEGLEPYTVHATADVAAENFARFYNDNSIRDNQEYGSTIYEVTDNNGNATGYAYSVANVGTTGASVTPSNAPNGTTVVADAHTHAASTANASIAYDDNNFSGAGATPVANQASTIGDIGDNNNTGLIGYVATPNGSLQRYDPSTGNITTIATNVPSDSGNGTGAPGAGISAPSTWNHKVQRGDTLSDIANTFGTTVQAITTENNIVDPNRIQAGTVLNITN